MWEKPLDARQKGAERCDLQPKRRERSLWDMSLCDGGKKEKVQGRYTQSVGKRNRTIKKGRHGSTGRRGGSLRPMKKRVHEKKKPERRG